MFFQSVLVRLLQLYPQNNPRTQWVISEPCYFNILNHHIIIIQKVVGLLVFKWVHAFWLFSRKRFKRASMGIVHFPTQHCMRQWMIVQSIATFQLQSASSQFSSFSENVIINNIQCPFPLCCLLFSEHFCRLSCVGFFFCRYHCAIKQKSGPFSLKSAFISLFIPSMKMWTAPSAKSLEYKRNGAELTCFILFSFINVLDATLFIQLIQL